MLDSFFVTVKLMDDDDHFLSQSSTFMTPFMKLVLCVMFYCNYPIKQSVS